MRRVRHAAGGDRNGAFLDGEHGVLGDAAVIAVEYLAEIDGTVGLVVEPFGVLRDARADVVEGIGNVDLREV